MSSFDKDNTVILEMSTRFRWADISNIRGSARRKKDRKKKRKKSQFASDRLISVILRAWQEERKKERKKKEKKNKRKKKKKKKKKMTPIPEIFRKTQFAVIATSGFKARKFCFHPGNL